MPKNKIDDLRNLLFETMERLMDDDDMSMDLERAETVAKVAQVIVNSAKVEVDFIKQTGHGGTAFIQGPLNGQKQLAAVPVVEIAAGERHEDLCQKCPLPDCDDTSSRCLVQIQRKAA